MQNTAIVSDITEVARKVAPAEIIPGTRQLALSVWLGQLCGPEESAEYKQIIIVSEALSAH